MISLRSLPDTSTRWSEEHLSLPNDVAPGALVLHRHLTALSNEMKEMVAKGWTLVTDMDDDPDHFEPIAAFDFAAFRAVHAVTVSTERLRDIIRPYNPNVEVLENAILSLPDISESHRWTANCASSSGRSIEPTTGGPSSPASTRRRWS